MWNFVVAMFILGGSVVTLLHREIEGLVGLLVTVLWLSGRLPTRSLWRTFLRVGGLIAAVAWAIETWTDRLSEAAVLVATLVIGLIAAASVVLWAKVVLEARRERREASRELGPEIGSPSGHSRLRPNLLVEAIALVVLYLGPFALGAWAVEANFRDEAAAEEARRQRAELEEALREATAAPIPSTELHLVEVEVDTNPGVCWRETGVFGRVGCGPESFQTTAPAGLVTRTFLKTSEGRALLRVLLYIDNALVDQAATRSRGQRITISAQT